MGKRKAKIAGILLFLLLTAVLLFAAVRLLERKDSHAKYADFFSAGDKLEVLFLGSSHVINAVDPVQIYAEHGYTGYNLGGHGSLMNATYHMLLNALDHCAPKVVFIDVYMMEKDVRYLDAREDGADADEINVAIEQLHLNMDAFPLTRTKRAAVYDLVEDPKVRWEFLVPFSVYHNRWKELTRNDYLRLVERDVHNTLLGAEKRYEVFTGEEHYAEVPPDEGIESPGAGVDYLERTLELCAERGIHAVLTFYPFYPTEDDQRTEHAAGVIADAFDVPYLDFCSRELMRESAFDLRTDLNDHGHLNSTGMEKVSAYLGDYLEENADKWGLTDHRGEAGYELFEKRVEEAAAEASFNEAYEAAPSVHARLNLLNSGGVCCAVYVRAGSSLWQDEAFCHLMEKLAGNDVAIARARGEGLPYLLVRDPLTETAEEVLDGEAFEELATSAGALSYFGSGDYHNLHHAGAEDDNLLDMENGFYDEVQVVLIK